MAKRQLVKDISNYANANPHRFTPGTSYSWKQFRRMFNKFFPQIKGLDPRVTRQMPAFVAAYVDLNRVLLTFGLQIKANDYYERFQIVALDSDGIAAKLKHLSKRATNTRNYAKDLRQGLLTCNGTIRTMTATEEDSAVARIGNRIAPVPYR